MHFHYTRSCITQDQFIEINNDNLKNNIMSRISNSLVSAEKTTAAIDQKDYKAK